MHVPIIQHVLEVSVKTAFVQIAHQRLLKRLDVVLCAQQNLLIFALMQLEDVPLV
jgi:hypothetical protein